ncbi:PaaI family thioesterase [Parvibaculum sp.]|uniref:PaaI family thioesterase n=1 Tax=Parvibaculum sp. TaxID=2024848 RepID=UPI002730A2E5|nr:PaaI family thioesterase [Parvibaculum sp.]MDP1628333.1 PaaI family thioesterase [Parvibaculum sp.]MDP2149948.1 PaaI family thioesterase [Parvibaculum sp.]MDP3329446.1 PaaI family thioesterase [Parvibaculum sp.]
MGWWAEQIDRNIDGSSELPKVVQRLNIGRIAEWSPGYVRKEWELDPDMLNPANVLFGGYVGVLADQVFTFTAMTVLEDHESLRTSDMQIRFFRPIAAGPVKIEGRVVNRAKKSVHVDVTFTTPDGKLAAKASGDMTVLSNEPLLKAAREKG